MLLIKRMFATFTFILMLTASANSHHTSNSDNVNLDSNSADLKKPQHYWKKYHSGLNRIYINFSKEIRDLESQEIHLRQ